MVLVCWVKFRAGLFVSCDERREIRSRNHLQIWLLPGQWLGFSLKQEMYINVHTKHCFHIQKYTWRLSSHVICGHFVVLVFWRTFTPTDWRFYEVNISTSNSPSLTDCFPLWCTLPCCSLTLHALGTSTAGTGLAIIKPSWEPEPGTLLPHLRLLSLRCASLYPHESVVVQLPCRGGRGSWGGGHSILLRTPLACNLYIHCGKYYRQRCS